MLKLTRISIVATLLLLALFSLPFWLPGLQSPHEGSAEVQNAAVSENAALPTQDQGPVPKPSTPPSNDPQLPAMTLVDTGWLKAGTRDDYAHPPAIFRWDPAQDEVEWRLETDPMTQTFRDEEGRITLLSEDSLTILDAPSGEVLDRMQLQDMPASGPNSGRPFPIGRQGDLLYLRNYATQDNLFAYDLQRGAFTTQRWTVCENNYPFDSVYLPDENAFVTFCIDFSHGLQGLLTRLSLEDGTSTSVEIPALGADEYMTGNGFTLGRDQLAYVVDSDAGALVEIDLKPMQILRQANYWQAGVESSWLQGAVAWLMDLAAGPARAKRWMSQPVVSPDDRYLVVDGGFGVGGGQTTTAWLLDLQSLAPVQELKLPRSPQAFHFPSEDVLYILLQTDLPGTPQVVAFDLARGQTLTLDLPTSGRVMQFLP